MLKIVHIINQNLIYSWLTSPKHCTSSLDCGNFAIILEDYEKAVELKARCSQPCRVVTSFIIVINWLPNTIRTY